MIAIQRSEEPKILKTKGKRLKTALCSVYTRYQLDYDNGKRSFTFKRTIYAHLTVKQALLKMQHNKCCFCETKTKSTAHRGSGDVEHFRPKGGYLQDKHDKLYNLGYYWLVYQWDNLLLSCEPCNSSYKGNLFPLRNPEKRAKNHKDKITEEIPLLINPTQQNPEDYIGFNKDVPYAINGNVYGRTTIEVLKLKRHDLKKEREKVLNKFNKQLNIIRLAKKKIKDKDWQELAEESLTLIYEMAQPQAKYSAMIKAALHKTQ